MQFPIQRKISNKKSVQLGNFRFIFNQKNITLWNTNDCINELIITSVDEIVITKITLNTKNTILLYKHFIQMIKNQDSFYQELQLSQTQNISKIYGSFNYHNQKFVLEIQKEESYNGNTSIFTISMNDDDFKEFVFLFYFHFIIDLGII